MVSDLPLDLVDEILSRVPATSLKRFRSTCKQRWNALFKDQRFIDEHFRKAPKESLVFMLNEYKFVSLRVNLNVAPPSTEFDQGALCLKDSEQVEITEVFHCDGLLLCSTNDNRLVAWNPCLGETRWIQHKTGYERYSRFSLGYIQDSKSCRSYKILRRYWGSYCDQLFEIYEFSSDSWRVLDDVALDCDITCNGYTSGASSLKGKTYWLARDKQCEHEFIQCEHEFIQCEHEFIECEHEFILSFDYTAERFKHLCLPPFQNHGHCVSTLSVAKEELLSALNVSYNLSKIEMWLTNRIDADELLWSKSFIVDFPVFGNCFNIFTSLLIDAEKKVSLCCNGDDSNYRRLVYTIGEDREYYKEISCINIEQNCLPVLFNYVPSLVQIKQARRN